MNIVLMPTGELVANYLEENKISQRTLAERSGYSEKQVSLVINGKTHLTERFAAALEQLLPGTSSKFWLSYDQKFLEQEKQQLKEVKGKDYAALSSKFGLDKIFKGTKLSKFERISIFESAFERPESKSETYRFIGSPAFMQDHLQVTAGQSQATEAWLRIMSYLFSLRSDFQDPAVFCGADSLKRLLAENKPLFMIEEEDDLYRNIRFFCKRAGIRLIFSKSSPSIYVRGAVYPDNGEVVLVLTNRYKSVEYTIFAFIHELLHLVNGDVTPAGDTVYLASEDPFHEDDISQKAKNFLIPQETYINFSKTFVKTENQVSAILSFASENETTPGMVVTFLQHDGLIDYAHLRQFLHPLKNEGMFFDLAESKFITNPGA
jgi:plasmid maintenance system antidote protein VapI